MKSILLSISLLSAFLLVGCQSNLGATPSTTAQMSPLPSEDTELDGSNETTLDDSTAASDDQIFTIQDASSRVALAKKILANNHITLSRSGETKNGNPYQTILDTSRGLKATSGCSNNKNCGRKVYLNPAMLTGMLKVAQSYSLRINSTTGSDDHEADSYHYQGRAFDFDRVNGVAINRNNSRGVMAACRRAGAIEVLGPGYPEHDTHVHCAW